MIDQVVDHFVNEIREIEEADYGDFMRAANTYLLETRKELEREGIYDLSRKFDEMQMYLQFTPNWDVETTRARLISDSRYLDEILLAHRQDWESPPRP